MNFDLIFPVHYTQGQYTRLRDFALGAALEAKICLVWSAMRYLMWAVVRMGSDLLI